jgi:tetratricopeptide (TPR) repeat protein
MDRRSLAIDPIFTVRGGLYGVHLFYADQKDSAFSHLTRLSKQYPVCRFFLGAIYLQSGEYSRSINEIEKTILGFSPYSLTTLGLAYSKSGAKNETRRMLDTLEFRAKSEFVPYSMRGALLAELGEKKKALDFLKKGYDEKEEFLLLMKHIDTISFSSLRKTQEFVEIMNKIKNAK